MFKNKEFQNEHTTKHKDFLSRELHDCKGQPLASFAEEASPGAVDRGIMTVPALQLGRQRDWGRSTEGLGWELEDTNISGIGEE